MKYLDDMVNRGLAEVSTADRQALALTYSIQLVQYRDRCYRFYMALAGPIYQTDTWYWLNRERN